MGVFRTIGLDRFVADCEREHIGISSDIRDYVGKDFRIGKEILDPDYCDSLGISRDSLGPAMRWGYLFDTDGWRWAKIKYSYQRGEYVIVKSSLL